MKRNVFLLLTILCLALSLPAFADLYNNGPTNGTHNAFFIGQDQSYVLSDSFKPTASGDIMSFTFAQWVTGGALPTTVDWTISSTNALSGNILESGTNASITAELVSSGSYDLYDSTVTVGSIPVKAGQTYWLTLTNADDTFGSRSGWDINSGPSMAFHNLVGKVPSESFTINGGSVGGESGRDAGTTPEPGSIMLFGSGILGLAGILRRKLS